MDEIEPDGAADVAGLPGAVVARQPQVVDLDHLRSSTHIGRVFVDRQRKVRTCTAGLTGLCNLVDRDRGHGTNGAALTLTDSTQLRGGQRALQATLDGLQRGVGAVVSHVDSTEVDVHTLAADRQR